MQNNQNIIITGADGKMGKALIEAITKQQNVQLVGAIASINSHDLLKDAGASQGIATGVKINHSLSDVLEATNADVVIDFTRPKGTLDYLEICIHKKIPMVIGTTGFSNQEKLIIEEASKIIPIVFSPNFSIGVNLTFALAGMAARVLNDDYDIEIIEAHHRQKIDAPSGTALRIGEVIAENKHWKLADVAVYDRHALHTARKANSIGFSAIRAGDIVGDHTVLFASPGERIEITHKASNRLTFANGAVVAANWLKTKTPGLYSMQDVLHINHLSTES